MKCKLLIYLFLLFSIQPVFAQKETGKVICLRFYNADIKFTLPDISRIAVDQQAPLSPQLASGFLNDLSRLDFTSLRDALSDYKKNYAADDWMFYQLVRKIANTISPKASNYSQYTLYKYFLMQLSGYDPLLTVNDHKLLFYIHCDENIYNIPYRMKEKEQYVCLNYHDYGSNIDFTKEHFEIVPQADGYASPDKKIFSYKITRLPDFSPADYTTRQVNVNINDNAYTFKIKVTSDVKDIFKNYPVVDYSMQFNTPVSEITRSSLIPLLQKHLKRMSQKDGIDYLMHFSRYAFVFEPDTKIYGTEKRLTPEQTLCAESSDCEDRAALFFYLVKEIYNLPMIVLSYPQHVTIAINFNRKAGRHPIMYNGQAYYVCEPTPQASDLLIGQGLPQLRHAAYEVVYAYQPR